MSFQEFFLSFNVSSEKKNRYIKKTLDTFHQKKVNTKNPKYINNEGGKKENRLSTSSQV